MCEKCDFFTWTIRSLGQVIRLRHLEIVPITADAIKRLKSSTHITKLCSFVRQSDVFRRVVLNQPRLAASLSNNQQKDQPKHFCDLTADGLSAMREQQEKVVSSPIHLVPNARRKYILDFDACYKQVG